MTVYNYCKQSPQSLQPGCCTGTRIFPAASRGSADHDRAAEQGAFCCRPCLAAGAVTRFPRARLAAFCPVPVQGQGGAAGRPGRAEGGDGMCNALGRTRLPGHTQTHTRTGTHTPARAHTDTHPPGHTHPAVLALPAAGTNKLPPTNWDTKH